MKCDMCGQEDGGALHSELVDCVENLKSKLDRYEKGDTKQWILDELELRADRDQWKGRADQLSQELEDAQSQLETCQKECEEQARLNGMGSEREARLLARLDSIQNYCADALYDDGKGGKAAYDGYSQCAADVLKFFDVERQSSK